MKRFALLLIAVIAAATLCACGSQKAQLENDPIIGKWSLTATANETETGDASDTETIYTFDPDGTVTGIDNGTKVSGTWKKAGDSAYKAKINENDMKFTLEEDGKLVYQIVFGGVPMVDFIFEKTEP